MLGENKKPAPKNLFFETSTDLFSPAVPLKLQARRLTPLGSNNPYALTQQSRKLLTDITSFKSSARK